MITFHRRADKDRANEILGQILAYFFMPGLPPPDKANITEHLAWLARQPGDMTTQCALQTFPERGNQTRITIVIGFDKGLGPDHG